MFCKDNIKLFKQVRQLLTGQCHKFFCENSDCAVLFALLVLKFLSVIYDRSRYPEIKIPDAARRNFLFYKCYGFRRLRPLANEGPSIFAVN